MKRDSRPKPIMILPAMAVPVEASTSIFILSTAYNATLRRSPERRADIGVGLSL